MAQPELWHVCCLQKKHRGEKAGAALKQKPSGQRVKKDRMTLEESVGEQEASAQQPALPKQRAKEDIQISDSDLDDVNTTLSGYMHSTGLSPLHSYLNFSRPGNLHRTLETDVSAVSHHVQS